MPTPVTIQNPRIIDNLFLWEAFQGINNGRVYADFKISDNFYLYQVILASVGGSGMDIRGAIDASTNPNYPVGLVGDVYRISVAGKIGGAAGFPVSVGDVIICFVASAAGTQAAVGANWNIKQVGLQRVFEVTFAGGDLATNVVRDSTTVIGRDLNETVTGGKLLSVTGNTAETYIGSYTWAITGNYSETVNTTRYIRTVNAASGNTAVNILGTYVETVTGLHTIASATVFFSGNVGIGINAPLAKLHMKGADDLFNTTLARWVNNSGRELVNISNRGELNVGGAPGSGVAVLYVVSQELLFNLASFRKQNGQLAQEIGSTGSHVWYLAGVADSNYGGVTGDWGLGTAAAASARVHIVGRATVNPLRVDTNALTNRLVVDLNGNVGIGTATITSPLQVIGLTDRANNAAAVAAGIGVGGFYYTNVAGDGILKVVI